MGQVIRAFIAIELPNEVREKLAGTQQRFQSQLEAPVRKSVRWTPPGNIHLTLKFLGDVSTASLPLLIEFLTSESSHHQPFSLAYGGIGAFPNRRHPRVIWAGCEATPELASLQKAIDSGTGQLGFPSDHRLFSAHLTLGRVTQTASQEEVETLAQALGRTKPEPSDSFTVDRFHLFQSDLRPAGAVYTILKIFFLSMK